jgi:hypothetical protein
MAVNTRNNPPAGMEALVEKIKEHDDARGKFIDRLVMCLPQHVEEHALYLLALEERIEALEKRSHGNCSV